MSTPTSGSDTALTVEVLTGKVQKAAQILLVIPAVQKYVDGKKSTLHSGTPDGNFVEDFIWERLGTLGIYKDEESHSILVSKSTREGDARKLFCENGNPQIPIARFSAMWAILKETGLEDEPKSGVDELVTALQRTNYGQWSDEALLRSYNADCEVGIITALQKRSLNKKFVVFKDETAGTIDVETTLRFLRECRRQRDIPVTYRVGDSLKKLYAAGDFPSVVYHECPFHSNVLLFDGYCDECCHSWAGVEDEVRQFARLVKTEGNIPTEGPTLRQFVNEACRGIDDLSLDYPKVKLLFDDLKQEGKLPVLRRRTATQESSNRIDPLGKNKRY